MTINLQQKNYSTGNRNYQIRLPIDYEVKIPEDDSVRLVSELYNELLALAADYNVNTRRYVDISGYKEFTSATPTPPQS
ncbi:MAG: hypothetical protein FWE91_08840 [Defluviitaleaceae bacterium]|nr:hypothetical protein [Defluviitaleaceae bacterium]